MIRAADHVVDMGPGRRRARRLASSRRARPTRWRLQRPSFADRPVPVAQGAANRGAQAAQPRPGHRRAQAADGIINGASGNNLRGKDVASRRDPGGPASPASPASAARARARWSTTRCTTAVARKLYQSHAEPAAHERIDGLDAFRQGHQRRPEPHRPHAAQQPGHLHRAVHADPRAVRRGADGARTRLRRRAASASTSAPAAGAARPAKATA